MVHLIQKIPQAVFAKLSSKHLDINYASSVFIWQAKSVLNVDGLLTNF
jgi:hypothetical protein